MQLGACSDQQTAADTAQLSGVTYTGAASFCFIQAVEQYGPQQPYGQLLAHMTQALARLGKTSQSAPSAGHKATSIGLPVAMGLALGPLGLVAGAMMAGPGVKLSEQLPVLCCSEPLDVARVPLQL
jgi:hypothetical protein